MTNDIILIIIAVAIVFFCFGYAVCTIFDYRRWKKFSESKGTPFPSKHPEKIIGKTTHYPLKNAYPDDKSYQQKNKKQN